LKIFIGHKNASKGSLDSQIVKVFGNDSVKFNFLKIYHGGFLQADKLLQPTSSSVPSTSTSTETPATLPKTTTTATTMTKESSSGKRNPTATNIPQIHHLLSDLVHHKTITTTFSTTTTLKTTTLTSTPSKTTSYKLSQTFSKPFQLISRTTYKPPHSTEKQEEKLLANNPVVVAYKVDSIEERMKISGNYTNCIFVENVGFYTQETDQGNLTFGSALFWRSDQVKDIDREYLEGNAQTNNI